HILENSGARLLVIEAALLGALEHVDLPTLPVETIWLVDGPSDGARAPASACPLPALGEAVAAPPIRPSDTLAILYTSGTTGPSKGVCCPHAQFFWWGLNTSHLLGVRIDDVLCTTLPLFHTNALNTFFQALITGATAVFEKHFSASAFWTTLAARHATVTYLLGAMVPILLSREAQPEECRHRTRIALAPGVPEHFHAEFAQRTGIALLDGYGSTETNFVIGTQIADQKPGAMGRIFEGFAARVVDDEDNEVPDGTPGELILRAEAPFAFATGYFGTPEKTVEAWRNLWFHTGDRVIREGDGYFRFVDRLKDAIRRRGENISSFEVEQVLLSHPEIATAAAYPVRSDLAEDEVMAAIVR
ncbi:MAG: AMP-binding protein, partial [Solimonas sp.]